MSATNPSDDPFESLHSLEETFYQVGYASGVADGSRSGRVEGRVFGLEKGFEKFVELGKLAGRAEVWKQRSAALVYELKLPEKKSSHADDVEESISRVSLEDETDAKVDRLPSLNPNPRLEKHISTLWDLVEPATYDTRNTEDAIADFDDRFKRAKAKTKVIEKIIGEEEQLTEGTNASGQSSAPRRDIRISREQAQEKNMEDFGRNSISR